MSTQTTDDDAPDETTAGFRLRWRGYDRQDVERFVRTVTADRRKLDETFARLDALIASRQDGRAEEVVANAHRQADEIRAAAEQQARQLLRDAESQGDYLQCERLKASRREIERLALVRQDIEHSLETAISALRKAHGTSIGTAAIVDAPTSTPRESDVAAQVQTAPTTEPKASRARRLMWTVLGLWIALAISVVMMLRMPPATIGPIRAVVAPVRAEPITQPAAEPVAPQVQPVAQQAAPSASAAELSQLTVTIIATRECWISTAVDDGEPQERLLRASERLVLNAADVVVLKAGNAAAVSLLLNDQQAAPLGTEGQVVTRRITRANFRTLLAADASRG
jgi:uncharacterized protein DUF4115